MPANIGSFLLGVDISNGETSLLDIYRKFGYAPSAVISRSQVTFTGSAFTAITVPTGAQAVCILIEGTVSLTLKSLTGDATGILLTGSGSNAPFPVVLPLASGATLGLLNGSATAASLQVIFFA